MSDPAAELRTAIVTALKADSGVIAAFAAAARRIYPGPPPTGAPMPYIMIPNISVLPDIAECIDGAETDVQIDIWSRMDPPAFDEAQRIGAAAQVVALAIGDTASHRMMGAWLLSADYLQDPGDAQAVHGVVRVRYSTEPL